MAEVTVLTPTYNRAYQLKRLYESLLAQTDRDFIWLIVDDGSTDGTEELLQEWLFKNELPLKTIRKSNGGKHTALNMGISQIESPWTFIVDSDDYLTENAIEVIRKKASEDDCDEICGLAFLRQTERGNYLTNRLVPQNGMVDDYIHCRYGLDIQGDMAEVWKTRYLKEFPFPVFENEKFCSEDVVWIRMAQKYKMCFYNEVIYISDYLEGGLTKTRRRQNLNSPRGVMHRGVVQLDAGLPLKYKCRAMMYYQVYGRAAGFSQVELFRESKHQALFACVLPLSMMAFKKLTEGV